MTRSIDPDKRAKRPSPIPLATLYEMYRCDGHWSLLFAIAAAEGRGMKPDGTFGDFLRGERPAGVWVGKEHRERILGTIGLSNRQWNRAAEWWVGLFVAHRCDRKGIFLFVTPSTTCLRCGISGRSASSQEDVLRPASGRLTPRITNEVGIPNGIQERETALDPDVAVDPQEEPHEGVQSVAPLGENEITLRTADEAWDRMHPQETTSRRREVSKGAE